VATVDTNVHHVEHDHEQIVNFQKNAKRHFLGKKESMKRRRGIPEYAQERKKEKESKLFSLSFHKVPTRFITNFLEHNQEEEEEEAEEIQIQTN